MVALSAPAATGRPHPAAALLQVLGLAGSSHLLEQIARKLVGLSSNELARRLMGEEPGATVGAGLDVGDPVFGWIAVTALGSAVIEELFFRGLLFEGLRRWRGAGFAVVTSAVLFGAAHLDLHHGLVAAVLGLQLGMLRQLHGLPIAIAAHGFNNALWLAMLAVGPHHPIARALPSACSLTIAALLAGSAWAALVQGWRQNRAT